MGKPNASQQRGLTLVESMIALAITAVTVGTIAPSLGKLQDRRRLEAAAAQLQTELQYARSLAVARNQSVRFSFQADAANSCYVIHTGSANACRCLTGVAVCSGAAQAMHLVRYEASSRLRSTSNSASFLFDATRGTVSPTATLEVKNLQSDALRLVVNIMGRVRSCTTTGLPGYKAC